MGKKTDDKEKLYEQYFNYTKKHKEECGEKTVVLMHVGGFYEMYGLKNDEDIFEDNTLIEVTNICGFDNSPRKCGSSDYIRHNGYILCMAGMPIHTLDRHLDNIVNAGWTVAIYDQDPNIPTNPPRNFTNIFSPGSKFSTDNTVLSNNICCIWLEVSNSADRYNKNIGIGFSIIDIHTGKSFVSEIVRDYLHNPDTFDELESLLSIYNPIETTLIHNLDENEVKDIIQYIGLNSKKIHVISTKDNNNRVTNCLKQTYRNEINKEYYANNSIIKEMFNEHHTLAQSFCYLLNYLYYCNPDIIKLLDVPKLELSKHNLITANHSLRQLQIISDNVLHGTKSSISTLLNKCNTPMGKRLFNHDILHPIVDSEQLNIRYDITEHIINNKDKYISIRNKLSEIKDLNFYNRKLAMGKIYPNEIYNIYSTLIKFIEIAKIIKDDDYIYNLFSTMVNFDDDIINLSSSILDDIINVLDIDTCKNINSDININIIRKGYNTELDSQTNTWCDYNTQLDVICKYYNDIIKSTEKNARSNSTVNIQVTSQSGIFIYTTKTRAKRLKEFKKPDTYNIEYTNEFDNTNKKLIINNKDLEFSSKNDKTYIKSKQIDSISNNITRWKSITLNNTQDIYKEFIEMFNKNYDNINNISNFIAILDKYINSAYISIENNYCRPIIDDTPDKSFIDCKDIRHPLIEKLLDVDEAYVTNDISLGKEHNGMLIYGVNMVGKTSIIKSIGVNIIMAQSGLFVASREFRYKPYTQIFTRILAIDNIFKSLSTFAVEMTELNTILNRADKNSLILGDELCSGTEINSANAIFSAGVITLHNTEATFLFATHLHNISKTSRIKELEKLSINHMAITRNNGEIIYDRKLRPGAGHSSYGLEICRALNLPDDFIQLANTIRSEDYDEPMDILNRPTCKYNSKKITGGLCEECGQNPATETHHMQPQQDADVNGYINNMHKNNPANLQNICKPCHNKKTKHNIKEIRKKSSAGNIVQQL